MQSGIGEMGAVNANMMELMRVAAGGHMELDLAALRLGLQGLVYPVPQLQGPQQEAETDVEGMGCSDETDGVGDADEEVLLAAGMVPGLPLL
jgi:hypothetical protein